MNMSSGQVELEHVCKSINNDNNDRPINTTRLSYWVSHTRLTAILSSISLSMSNKRSYSQTLRLPVPGQPLKTGAEGYIFTEANYEMYVNGTTLTLCFTAPNTIIGADQT